MPGSLLRVVLRQLRSLLSALDSIQAVWFVLGHPWEGQQWQPDFSSIWPTCLGHCMVRCPPSPHLNFVIHSPAWLRVLKLLTWVIEARGFTVLHDSQFT
jgi:hypothetical protein